MGASTKGLGAEDSAAGAGPVDWARSSPMAGFKAIADTWVRSESRA
jgi:hypothetical protein